MPQQPAPSRLFNTQPFVLEEVSPSRFVTTFAWFNSSETNQVLGCATVAGNDLEKTALSDVFVIKELDETCTSQPAARKCSATRSNSLSISGAITNVTSTLPATESHSLSQSFVFKKTMFTCSASGEKCAPYGCDSAGSRTVRSRTVVTSIWHFVRSDVTAANPSLPILILSARDCR